MLSAFTTSFHRDVLKDQTLENQIRNRWTLSEGAVIAFYRGVIRLEQLAGTEVQMSFFLGRNPTNSAQYDILYSNHGGKAPVIYSLTDDSIENVIYLITQALELRVSTRNFLDYTLDTLGI